jgi:hypothetical protein
MWTSPDAAIWTERTIPVVATLSLSTNSVIWVPELGKFIAGGGNTSTIGYSFLTSTDGTTWTSAGGRTTADFTVTAVAYSSTIGKTLGVVNSAGPGEYSSDLSNWFAITGVQNGLTAIIWVSELGKFITVGPGLQAGYSTNGTSFTSATPSESAEWQGLAWSPSLGIAVAVARTGTKRVMYTSDGATWSNTSVTGAGSYNWTAVTWSIPLSKFFAVGEAGRVMSSSDGLTWTAYTGSLSRNLRAISSGIIFA